LLATFFLKSAFPVKTSPLDPFVSSKFRFWSFLAMALLVVVHEYNLNIRYLQPWTLPGEALTLTGFTEYFLADGLLRFRIPMLFIISGFLFAMNDYRPYKQRAWKRFRTLIVPYLIWSALGILLVWFLEFWPYGRELVANSNVVQIDNSRDLIHQYRWYELLFRWLFLPIPYQLWFIRVLFFYNLAYPLILWCLNHNVARWIFLSVATLLWLGTAGFIIFEGEGLLFFTLGVWIRKTGFNIETPPKLLNPLWWGIAFVTLAAAKTILAFTGEPWLGKGIYPSLTLMHKVMIFSGLVTCWYGFDNLVRWAMARRWFVWLVAFSFIIYVAHAPMVAFCIDPVIDFFRPSPYARMWAFMTLPVLILSFCIGTGWVLRTLAPKVYGVLTGGRGF